MTYEKPTARIEFSLVSGAADNCLPCRFRIGIASRTNDKILIIIRRFIGIELNDGLKPVFPKEFFKKQNQRFLKVQKPELKIPISILGERCGTLF